MTSRLDEARAALKTTFGYDDFRPGQDEVIGAVLDGTDVFAVMPTGSGKSMTYQLPALVESSLTVVVSPLIALMHDQVQQMLGFGGLFSVYTYLASTMLEVQTGLLPVCWTPS
jgi:ATP-dependent DNA helicase RecQ